jgi:hypothetical protein
VSRINKQHRSRTTASGKRQHAAASQASTKGCQTSVDIQLPMGGCQWATAHSPLRCVTIVLCLSVALVPLVVFVLPLIVLLSLVRLVVFLPGPIFIVI